MNKPGISVVIPNYNGKHLLEANIPPLKMALEKAETDYEIIISDDASIDDSVPFLQKDYPEIRIILKDRNEGFSATVNKGIQAAKKDLVFILNSDVILTENYFLPLFKYFENKDTFGVMGRIISMDSDYIQDGAKYPSVLVSKINSGLNYIPARDLPENVFLPSFYLSGANALVDREKLLELGGFDELYSPFYGEDVDLSLRAWRAGWYCYYEHTAICRHPASTTIMNYNSRKKIKIISTRNRFFMHYIHLKGWRLTLWNIGIVFELLFKWLTLRTEYYKAFFMFVKKFKTARKSRKRLEHLCTSHKDSRRNSLYQVVKEIKTPLKSISIRKF
jgi:GT2 family glycosyltransferase